MLPFLREYRGGAAVDMSRTMKVLLPLALCRAVLLRVSRLYERRRVEILIARALG